MMTATSVPRTIDSMPAHARIWIYKSAKAFTREQRRAIIDRGHAFAGSWAAHGAPLDACVDVLFDRFVVIAVDEQQAMASGCGIDKSVRFIQDLERDLALHLTDRMIVPYEKDGSIRTCRVPEVEDLLKRGEMTPDTIVFDDLLTRRADLDTRFRLPLRGSWMQRYL